MSKDIERKIAVIFVTDVVAFSKMMEKNEDETLRSFRSCRDILDNLFKEHGGRIFNTAGDSVLAEFQSAVSAVICAKEFQKLIRERNANVAEDAAMEFRIGLNMGDVIVEGENLYGEQVKVRFVNANDRTVEGLDIVGKSVFTVQFHPEAAPGPHDAYPLFARFRKMVDSHYGGGN